MWPLFVLIILIILYPIARVIADKDIEESNKKVEEHYKAMEAKHKEEYEKSLKNNDPN